MKINGMMVAVRTWLGIAVLSMASIGVAEAATPDDAESQKNLGIKYYNGNGVAQDYAKAFELFQKSAAQGNAGAQYALGVMYEQGKGVANDNAKAFEWYQKSAAQGLAAAQGNLGFMYLNGKSVTRDDTKAFEWYQKSAAQGFVDAQYALGALYENGLGTTRDNTKAVEWYQKAAAQGNANAQERLKRINTKNATPSNLPAGITADIQQRVMQAAMGHLEGGHFTTTDCPPPQSGRDQYECNNIDLAVARDAHASIDSVVNIIKQAGVIHINADDDHSQCGNEGSMRAEELIRRVASLHIDENVPSNRPLPRDIQDKHSQRLKEDRLNTIQQQFNGLNSICDPRETQQLLKVMNWLNHLLEPMQSARLKETKRIKEEVRIARVQMEEEQQRKAEAIAQERKAKQRKLATEEAKREAQKREQAQIEEAERMKDPAYRAAKEKEIDRAQRRRKCLDDITSNYLECLAKNPGYANVCADVHKESIPICQNIP